MNVANFRMHSFFLSLYLSLSLSLALSDKLMRYRQEADGDAHIWIQVKGVSSSAEFYKL